MPKPKPVYVNENDFNQVKNDLEALIQETNRLNGVTAQATESRLQGAIQGLADKVAKNAETSQQAITALEKTTKGYAEGLVQKLRQELDATKAGIEPRLVELGRSIVETNARVAENAARIQEVVTDLATNIDAQLRALQEMLEQSVVEVRDKSAAELVKQRQELEEKISQSRKDAKAQDRLVKEAADKEFQRLGDDMLKVRKEQDDTNLRAFDDIQQKLERHEAVMKAMERAAEASLQKVASAIQLELTEMRNDTQEQFGVLTNQGAMLTSAVNEVENFSTRRVDWVITNASRVVRPNSPSKAKLHRSWFSPKFNAAGTHGLQLEMQLFKPANPPAPDEENGDCAVYLWAVKGVTLVYRLYIGDKYQTVEKVFNGRVPYGTRRFCFFKDQINRLDDTLKVSVEFLECHRQIETVIEQPPLEPGAIVIEGDEYTERPLEGQVVFHRHINNRVFDQVKTQCDLMRSRMVRKVEWRLEQASCLRSCFPNGECLCSTQFNAAGLEGMQLLFYPSGYKGCTEGFCSLFLYGPAGCTVKCCLVIGNQRREATHSFLEPGAFGRTNFCIFKSIVDEDSDTIHIALEIDEAHQDLVARMSNPSVTPGDRRTQAQIEGSGPHAIESVVKLQGNAGRLTSGLEETRVLPSLWTPFSADAVPQAPDGMRSFEELRKRGGKSGGGQAVRSSPATKSNVRIIESSSKSFAEVGFDITSTGNSPLPRLAKTFSAGGFEQPSPQSNQSRRSRRERAGLASTTSLGLAAC